MKKPLFFLVSGLCLAAQAEVAEPIRITVYASRIEDDKADMPVAVQTFDAEEIAASGARDLPDLLEKKAGIDIHRLNSNPIQSEIAMRGFGESAFGRVKVVVDGEELNNVDMVAPNLMRVPLANVERVEVLRGPSPVLYGDGAVGGVVNVSTDSRDYESKTRVSASGGSQGTFGANISAKGGDEEKGVQYAGAYDYLRSDGYRSRSGYDMHTADASVRQNYDDESTLAIHAHYQNAFYELPGALSYEQWKEDRKAAAHLNDWNRIWNYGLGLDSKFRMEGDQWLYFDGAFSQQHRHAFWGDYGYDNDYDIYGVALSPRYVNEGDVFGAQSKFTLGLDLRYDRDNIRDRSGYNSPRYHFDRFRAALFAHEEYWLTDNLAAIAGARGETIRNRWTHYQGLDDTDSEDWMGDAEVGLVYRPSENVKTFARATRFHRSPFCDEMNYTENGKLLKPETGYSLDIGTEWKILDELTFDADAYGMLMDDEIFFNPHASEGAWGWNGYNCNSPSRTRRIGLDTGLSWKRDKVAEAYVRYGIVSAEFTAGQYDGNDVPRVPLNRVAAGAGVWLWDDLEIGGSFRFTSSQKLVGDFGNENGELASYAVFGLDLRYEPSWAEGWKMALVLDNLFDRDYCDFAGWSDFSGAYYYPASGRTFLATLSCAF
jgi:iron complex outermembrane receptor protein